MRYAKIPCTMSLIMIPRMPYLTVQIWRNTMTPTLIITAKSGPTRPKERYENTNANDCMPKMIQGKVAMSPMLAATTRTARELYRMPSRSAWVLRSNFRPHSWIGLASGTISATAANE